jgi:hypothetical protein
MLINGKQIVVKGRIIKIASIDEDEEWFVDIDDPNIIIKEIYNNKIKADVFTFWQRLPNTTPKYDYYMEWDSVAALPVTTYKEWWEKQIDAKTRNVIRKAEKKGIEIRMSAFDEELVKGITDIFNETPIRQGRPFTHYGQSYDSVKDEMADNINRSDFIGAYLNDILVGFIKIIYAGPYAMTVEILSMIEHRDKSPTNALVAKAVELCEEKKIPYLVYAKWPLGPLAEFKKNNGFHKIDLPRYYVPLTVKGKIALKWNLHHGIKELIPEKQRKQLIDIRKKWYEVSTMKR